MVSVPLLRTNALSPLDEASDQFPALHVVVPVRASVAPLMTVSAPPRADDQLPTVSVRPPLTVSAPSRSRLCASPSSMASDTFLSDGMVAASVAFGTPAGVQLSAVCQSFDVEPSNVRVTALAGAASSRSRQTAS